MATLADINKSLLGQSTVLESVAKNTDRTGDAINKFLSAMEISRKKQLETDSENRKPVSQRIADTASRAGGAASRAGSSLADKLTLPAGLLTGAGLTALGTSLFGGLARRGIPAAIGLTFADEIGNWVDSQTGSAALGDAAERATVGGSFGLLLGKRFGLIGAAIGALATDDNLDKLEGIGGELKTKFDGLKTSFKDFAKSVGITLPTLEGMQEGVGKGLDGIEALIKGDFEGFSENLLPVAGLLSATALMIAPGPFMRGLKNIAKFALSAKGGRLLAISAAIAAGTYVYDKFFDGVLGDDGSGEITTEDIVGGAAITAGTAAAAIATKRAISRRGMTPDEIAEQKNRNSRAPKPPKPGNIVKKNGKEFVQSKDGKLHARGTPQADMIETKGGTQSNPNRKWWSKFPRISGLGRVGPAGALFALFDSYQIASIMGGPGTKEEKIKQVGPLIGGLLGAAGGATLLGALGSVVPFLGTAVGATAGGLLGYFGGNFLGEKVAAYMLGKDVDALPPIPNKRGRTTSHKNANGDVGYGRTQSSQMDMMSNRSYSAPSSLSRPDVSGTLNPVAPVTSGASGSMAPVIMGSGNTSITNTSPQALMMNSGGAVDTSHDFDMLASSYRFP